MSDYIEREDALKAVEDIVCDADDAERTCDRIIDLPSVDIIDYLDKISKQLSRIIELQKYQLKGWTDR